MQSKLLSLRRLFRGRVHVGYYCTIDDNMERLRLLKSVLNKFMFLIAISCHFPKETYWDS